MRKDIYYYGDVVKNMRDDRVSERNSIEDEQCYCVILIAEDCMINMILTYVVEVPFLGAKRQVGDEYDDSILSVCW